MVAPRDCAAATTGFHSSTSSSRSMKIGYAMSWPWQRELESLHHRGAGEDQPDSTLGELGVEPGVALRGFACCVAHSLEGRRASDSISDLQILDGDRLEHDRHGAHPSLLVGARLSDQCRDPGEEILPASAEGRGHKTSIEPRSTGLPSDRARRRGCARRGACRSAPPCRPGRARRRLTAAQYRVIPGRLAKPR